MIAHICPRTLNDIFHKHAATELYSFKLNQRLCVKIFKLVIPSEDIRFANKNKKCNNPKSAIFVCVYIYIHLYIYI